jgi:hypothetical protein
MSVGSVKAAVCKGINEMFAPSLHFLCDLDKIQYRSCPQNLLRVYYFAKIGAVIPMLSVRE